jgi:hypothetical protein
VIGQRTPNDPASQLAAQPERPQSEPPVVAHPALAALARLLARQAVREWREQQHVECASSTSPSVPKQEQ